MYVRKNLRKIVIASVIGSSFIFLPSVYNFPLVNKNIVCAAIQTYTGTGKSIFNMKPTAEIVKIAKAYAQESAIQSAKEKAGVYIKSQTKILNATVTEDSVYAMTNKVVNVIDVKFKELPVEADDDIATKYEATVTVKIDTNSIAEYLKQNPEDRLIFENANKNLKKSVEENNKKFENLEKRSANAKTVAEQNKIKSELDQAYNEMLANQKIEQGWKLWEQKNFNGAIKVFDEAIKLNPKNAEGYYGRGSSYGSLGNFEKSIIDLNKSIQIYPNNAFVYSNLGTAYINLGNLEKSLENHNKAIQLDPSYGPFYSNRGIIYGILGNFDIALKDFTKAVQLNPNDALAYSNRGMAYCYLKQYEKAISDHNKAIQLAPYLAEMYGNRGITYTYMKKYNQAIIDLEKAIRIGTFDGEIYFCRGICYQEFGENKKAQADFAKAAELGYQEGGSSHIANISENL